MTFAFDLISDLHADQWPQRDWSGSATSPVCIVAGGISGSTNAVVHTLKSLGKNYQAVFYIDGDNEHANHLEHTDTSYSLLSQLVSHIPNVVYLQDNVVVADGVAILGTNGWWTYDLDPAVEQDYCIEWFQTHTGLSSGATLDIGKLALSDAGYLLNSIKRLQTHKDVKKIVVVSHTCPDYRLLSHDLDLDGKPQMSVMGNPHLAKALESDSENKIDTWVFGHYSGCVDQHINGVRYVSNPRGTPDSKYAQHAYHAKRICIDL